MKKSEAVAYTTIAMNRLGYSRREIEMITNQMLSEIGNYSIEEAEERADEILFREE